MVAPSLDQRQQPEPPALKLDLSKLRVAYVPYSSDFSSPGDRRRFCQYARLRGINFEPPRAGTSYDVVVLSSGADISLWRRRARDGTRIIFDLPDSYMLLDSRSELRTRLRGPAKFLFKQHAHLEWSYLDALAGMLRRADAVVCSTPEQREQISPHADNVHPILDFHGAEVRQTKTDYRAGDPFNLVWEGLGVTLHMFSAIQDVLARLQQRRKFTLHLVTDLAFRPVNGPVPRVPTRWMLRRYLPPGVRTFLYEWNEAMFARIATACDLAVIPVPLEIPICRAKAENKLLLLWRLGVPALTSASPAYLRTMKAAGVDGVCHSPADWEEKLHALMNDEAARRQAGEAGRRYTQNEHSDARRLQQWDQMFASVLGVSAGGGQSSERSSRS
jgi:hypothetical protein